MGLECDRCEAADEGSTHKVENKKQCELLAKQCDYGFRLGNEKSHLLQPKGKPSISDIFNLSKKPSFLVAELGNT